MPNVKEKKTVMIQIPGNQNPVSSEYQTPLLGNQMPFKIQTIQLADNFQSSNTGLVYRLLLLQLLPKNVNR